MKSDYVAEPTNNLFASVISLFASSGTLVCCALPALLVAIGAGASLSSLISFFPDIVWLSENKAVVFMFAGLMLSLSGYLQWRGRNAPCPLDIKLRENCLRTRQLSLRIYLGSVGVFLLGGWFAFVQPWLM